VEVHGGWHEENISANTKTMGSYHPARRPLYLTSPCHGLIPRKRKNKRRDDRFKIDKHANVCPKKETWI